MVIVFFFSLFSINNVFANETLTANCLSTSCYGVQSILGTNKTWTSNTNTKYMYDNDQYSYFAGSASSTGNNCNTENKNSCIYNYVPNSSPLEISYWYKNDKLINGIYYPDISSGAVGNIEIFGGTEQYQYNISTSTQITLTSPINTTLIANPVNIYGNYTNTGTYDMILWNIENTTIGMSMNIATSSIALANGQFNFYKNVNLTYNGNYTAQATLYNSSTGSSTLSNTINFGLNSTSTMAELGLTASTTDSFLLGFLNVPELVKTKVPFAYIFQIATALQTAIATTSTSNISTGSFNIKIGNNATTSVDMFSSSTIKYFFTDTYINIFRGLEVASLWVALAWFLYHDAKSKKLF